MAIVALISVLPLAWWISHHKEAQQDIIRGDETEEKMADAQASYLSANALIIQPKEPRKGINPRVRFTATKTYEQADYLATHILDWPTNSLNLSDLEGLRAFNRVLDIESSRIATNKVMLWSTISDL